MPTQFYFSHPMEKKTPRRLRGKKEIEDYMYYWGDNEFPEYAHGIIKFYDEKDITHESYDKYFHSINHLLPPNLVKYFQEEYTKPFPDMYAPNRFHDCAIVEIRFKGNSNVYRHTCDEVILDLSLGRMFDYHIVFNDIVSCRTAFSELEKYTCEPYDYFGEIIDCELSLSKDGFPVMQFDTSTGFEFYIEFDRVKITKKKRRGNW